MELPGEAKSETHTVATTPVVNFSTLLEPAAPGFFTKLWAAMRGIGPARSSDENAVGAGREVRKR